MKPVTIPGHTTKVNKHVEMRNDRYCDTPRHCFGGLTIPLAGDFPEGEVGNILELLHPRTRGLVQGRALTGVNCLVVIRSTLYSGVFEGDLLRLHFIGFYKRAKSDGPCGMTICGDGREVSVDAYPSSAAR